MRDWNHNIHYHEVVFRALPDGCRHALDVGCGPGRLARELARRCARVSAIDADHETLQLAKAVDPTSRIAFIEGDVMSWPFPSGDFDLIAAVATLHHLPLRPALQRFRDLLAPGGVLAIVGLYRSETLADYAWSAAAFPVSRTMRLLNRRTAIEAPLRDPRETLREIRAACDDLLPGAAFQRRLLFRYSLVWKKP